MSSRPPALGAARNAPSNRVAMGFIGVGWKGLRGCYGALVLDFLQNPACQAVAVCDVNRHFRKDAKATIDKHYGDNGCAMYADFRDLIARGDIDAVAIATPPHWHAFQMIYACRHGKDVYCEKPLSLTVREARAMVNAARRYGRVVQTGSQSRSFQTIRQGVELIRSGRIGQVVRINAGCGGPPIPCDLPAQPTPDFIDWDLWLGPAPWRPYHESLASVNWRPYRDYDGGGVTDWGCHHFDIGQWALGMDHSGPVEILLDRHAIFRYANGVEMHHVGNGVEFIGTEGKITLLGMCPRIKAEPERLAALRSCRKTNDGTTTRTRRFATSPSATRTTSWSASAAGGSPTPTWRSAAARRRRSPLGQHRLRPRPVAQVGPGERGDSRRRRSRPLARPHPAGTVDDLTSPQHKTGQGDQREPGICGLALLGRFRINADINKRGASN